MATLYTTLQVARDCSADELRRAYHRLARLHHPDKQHTTNETVGEKGGTPAGDVNGDDDDEAFRRVQRAYEVLRDAETRAVYDRELAQSELLLKRDVEDVRIADQVAVSEMERDEVEDGEVLYSHTCRCGDVYEVSEEELQDGVDVVPCNGCSLNIRVLVSQ